MHGIGQTRLDRLGATTGAGINQGSSSSFVGEKRAREKRAREGSGAQDKVAGKKPKTESSRSSRRPIASRKVLDERDRKAEAAKNSALQRLENGSGTPPPLILVTN